MAATPAGPAAAHAVDDLYRSHRSEVYRYAFAVLGNHADAEDVTQTTFLNAYRSLEHGVRPRRPSNWLLTIATNVVKQRFRSDRARPREVPLDERVAEADADDATPTVGEVLAALSRIPPQQRQAIVLREFEGRSYKEIAEILGVTTSALETLLFRARRSLADELENEITCVEAQFAISRLRDGRLGRKERRRLRAHLSGCLDCTRFARIQQRHRRALRGLALVPVPVSLTLFRGLEGTATAGTMPAAAAAGATGGGLFAGGVALKAAVVVTAASVAGGLGVVGATEVDRKEKVKAVLQSEGPGERPGQVAPRGVVVPGNGVAVGKSEQAVKPGRRVGQSERQGAPSAKPGRPVVSRSTKPSRARSRSHDATSWGHGLDVRTGRKPPHAHAQARGSAERVHPSAAARVRPEKRGGKRPDKGR